MSDPGLAAVDGACDQQPRCGEPRDACRNHKGPAKWENRPHALRQRHGQHEARSGDQQSRGGIRWRVCPCDAVEWIRSDRGGAHGHVRRTVSGTSG